MAVFLTKLTSLVFSKNSVSLLNSLHIESNISWLILQVAGKRIGKLEISVLFP